MFWVVKRKTALVRDEGILGSFEGKVGVFRRSKPGFRPGLVGNRQSETAIRKSGYGPQNMDLRWIEVILWIEAIL